MKYYKVYQYVYTNENKETASLVFCGAFKKLSHAKNWQDYLIDIKHFKSKIEYGEVTKTDIKQAWDNDTFISDSKSAYNILFDGFKKIAEILAYEKNENTQTF